MSAYVPPPDEVTPESNEVLLEGVRRSGVALVERLHARKERIDRLSQVTDDLIVAVEFVLDAYEDLDQCGARGHRDLGEFAVADVVTESRLDPLDLRDRFTELLVHARSLIADAAEVKPPRPALKSNEPPTLARDAGGSSTKGV